MIREILGKRRWPALFMLAIMVSMPVTVLAYGLDDGWSPLRRGALEPEGWRGGPLEDLLADGMQGDDALLRMLDHIGAMPEAAQVPVQSSMLGLAVPPQALPMLYEAEALSSASPLREAVLAYNAALDLVDADELLESADLRMADDLPFDAQIAIAVLLYAIADASLLQKQAVSGLSPEDYTAILGLPGMILSGRLDPTDGSEAADEDFARAYGLLSQVDKQRIDEAALVMVHSVSHAMPALREWGQREREQAQNPDARVMEIGSLLDQYTPQRIEGMDPIERLDILADTLRMAAGFQGVGVSPYLRPLPAPQGATPLRDAILDLAGVLESAGLPLGDLVEERELQRADALPRSMQVSVARIITNQAAVVQASFDLDSAVEAVASSVDADALADPDALTDPEALAEVPASQRDALLAALGGLRHAEIRTVLAVQEGAPTLEAWGLHWARGPSMLPATPIHAPGRLAGASAMAGAMSDPAASLQEVIRLASQARGIELGAVEPVLPPRGALADAVLELYERLGVDATPEQRDEVVQGAAALHPAVEQNTARILVAQLDALDTLETLEASLGVEDRWALIEGAATLGRLHLGEVSLRDVQAIRAHYEVLDRIETAYLGAAAGVAAAVDASSRELGAYADGATGHRDPVEAPKPKPWYAKTWSVVSSFQVVGTASAQSAPPEPVHVPAACPASPLADCGNDVWFMDPLLEVVVVSGLGQTRFDPRDMGKDWTRPGLPDGDRDPEWAAAVEPEGQLLTVDLGGDDVYRNNAGGAFQATVRGEVVQVVPRAAAVALDLGGDDRYLPAPAGFSYEAVQGAAVGGIGILYDRRGNDQYTAHQPAQGAGIINGIGVLLDGDGNDHYTATSFAGQGAGLGGGLGILVDRAGTDRYTLAGPSPVGQGGASGGGLGILVDASGDDVYAGGMQGHGTGGGIGVFADLSGEDGHDRTHPDGTAFGDGECWTSLRAPPSNAFQDTSEAASATLGFPGTFDGNAAGFAQNAATNATSLASVAAGDAEALAAHTGDAGLFVDANGEGCSYDPSPLIPDALKDVDPGETLQTVIDLVQGAGDCEEEHLICLANEEQGIYVFVLGDATDTLYDKPYQAILDIGGSNTYLARSSAAKLLVNFDSAGDDQYLAAGETCVQACNGILMDLGGNDSFVARGAAQGVSTSLGMSGVLFNAGGNDTYAIEPLQGSSVAQGSVVGVEAGTGILLDVAGDDRYQALSQGVVDSPLLAPPGTPIYATIGVGGSVGVFLDFSGGDHYQPIERQGQIQFSFETGLGVCCGRQPRSKGSGFAGFVDAGGADGYVGTNGNHAAPDMSHQRNGRMQFRPHAGLGDSGGVAMTGPHVVPGGSLFWDLDRDGPKALTDLASRGTGSFQLGPLGLAIGTPDGDHVVDDYVLFIDPGGDDTYRNNAGATVLREPSPTLSSCSPPPSPPVELSPCNGWRATVRGDATYHASQNYPLASLLVDLDGDDLYAPADPLPRDRGASPPPPALRGIVTQGSGFLGVGVLVDDVGSENTNPDAGADTYVARAMSQGFGLYGWGILWDRKGDDTYRYDPAVVKDPTIDGNLIAWLQYRMTHGNAVASGGTWVVQARGPGWERDCRVDIGEPGPFHGVAVSRSPKDQLAFSAYSEQEGVWQLFHVPELGALCQGGVTAPGSSRVASGQANPRSNQVHPQFAQLLTSNDILWQDDRDGTWSLYYKRATDASDSCTRPLPSFTCMGGGLLGSHDASSSNQTNPHAHGGSVVYQDDRHAGKQCPEGTWSIHRYRFNSQTEEPLSSGCGIHVKPRMSDDFVVWQTQHVDEDGEPVGSWNLTIYRLTGPAAGEERLVPLPGDQYQPVVVKDVIVYTDASPDGQHSVRQYFWSEDALLDSHRVERAGAVQPALDPQNRFRAVWVDTTGQPARGGDAVGSDYWEVARRALGSEALPEVPGSLQSNAAGTRSLWLQGASYAHGRGVLFEQGGLDTYAGDQFAQGAAASLVGPKASFRLDASIGLEGMLGMSDGEEVGAFGMVLDADGNDAYTVRSMGQGIHFAREVVRFVGTPAVAGTPIPPVPVLEAEAMASLGLLLDLRGNDGFAANRNSQGYGALAVGGGATMAGCFGTNANTPCPPLRLYLVHSYGLFMDLGGLDRYAYPQPLYQRVSVQDNLCGTAEAVAVAPLRELLREPNRTARETAGSLSTVRVNDTEGEEGVELFDQDAFNQTFNDTLEKPISFLVEEWPEGIPQEVQDHLDQTAFEALQHTVDGLLTPLLGLCHKLEETAQETRDTLQEDLTGDPPRTRERNNELWRQKTRLNEQGKLQTGDIENTGKTCHPGGSRSEVNSPCAVLHVGGIGMDLLLMDNLNAALRDLADGIINTTIDVTALDERGEVQEGRIMGSVVLVTQASFEHDLGLRFERAEFFAGLNSDLQFLGNHVGAPQSPGESTWVFNRPWHTDRSHLDGPYELQVRVHYGHPVFGGMTLGYAEKNDVFFDMDNLPVILQAQDGEAVPFVSDSLAGNHLADFSPFPYGEDQVPGHPVVTFEVSPDLPTASAQRGHDAWVRVEVVDVDGEVVAVLESTEARAGQRVATLWDGTNGEGETVPAGRYWIRINATDRDPGDWSEAERVRTEEFPVVVYSNTPRNGCVLGPGGKACNAAHFVTPAASGAEWMPGRAGGERILKLRLPLAAATDPGGVPPGGKEDVRRYHVRLGVPDGEGDISWEPPVRLSDGARSYDLHIGDGEVWHVMVLAEDWAGNLECAPVCGGRTGAAVLRGDDETGSVLLGAFQRKLQLQLLPGGPPAFATFRSDFNTPIIRGNDLLVDGQRPAVKVPRVGPETSVVVTYVVQEDREWPIPKLMWVPDEDISLRRTHEAGHPAIDITLDGSRSPPWYNVSWDGWPDLVAEWPEGLVTLTLGATDEAGNAIHPRDQRVRQFLLDKGLPGIHDVRVHYPGGRLHAEQGDEVEILVRASDPDIGTFTTHPRKLRLGIDASNVTVAARGDDCTLQFDAGSGCFTAAGLWRVRVPINTTGLDVNWESLVAEAFNITIQVTDEAGNTHKENVELFLGAPRLGPQLVQPEGVGVYGANITWSTARETTAYLLHGEGTGPGDLRHRVNSTSNGTLHEFSLSGLKPGTRHVYRFVALDAESGAQEAGPLRDFATLHGVGMHLLAPAPESTEPLSGVYRVKGRGWVQAALDDPNLTAEPRVVIRLRGPGLPEGGRPVFDRATEDGTFAMDLVTDALQDGVFTLEATASYLGEEVTTTVDGLLVDNTAPVLRFVDPVHEAILPESPQRVLVRATEALTPLNLSSVQLHINGRPASVEASFRPDGSQEDGIIEIKGLPRLKPGIQRIEVFAQDAAGNPGHASIRVLHDPHAPEAAAEVLYPAGQVAARPGQWVTLRVGGASDASGVARVTANTTTLGGTAGVGFVREAAGHVLEVPIPDSLPGGTYPVPVRVEDAAGNARWAEAPVLVDRTPPSTPIVDMAPRDPHSAIAHVSASEPVAVVLDAVAEGLEGVRVVADDLVQAHALELPGIQAGAAYNVTVRVRDGAGNEVAATQAWTFLPEVGQAPPVDNLTAAATPAHVRLTWGDVGDGFRYAVHRAQNGSFHTVAVATGATHTDHGVQQGSSYRYFVQALDPHGRYGAPSRVIDVRVPTGEVAEAGSAVAVHPTTGFAHDTEFVFTAVLRDARDADPSAWLVLDGEPRRMSKSPGQDCRQECTFVHNTRLPAIDMRKPALEYHIEILDASGAARLPEDGSLEGPMVLSRDDGPVSAPERAAPSPPALALAVALAAAVLIIRRRRDSQ